MKKLLALLLLCVVLASVAWASFGELPLLTDDPEIYTVHFPGPPPTNVYVAAHGNGTIECENIVYTYNAEDGLYHAANGNTFGFDGYDTGDATFTPWPSPPLYPQPMTGSYDHN